MSDIRRRRLPFTTLAAVGLGVASLLVAAPAIAAPSTATVTGHVTDAAGRPLAGVGIRIGGSLQPVVTTTNTAGLYRARVDAVRQYVCFDPADATGGTSTTGWVKACAGPKPFAPGAVVTVDRTLATGAAASGRVTDRTGRPVADATVRITAWPDVTTGGDGRWSVRGLAPSTGSTALAVPPPGAPGPDGTGLLARCFGDTDPQVGICVGSGFTLVAGRTVSGLDIVLPSGGAVTGRVTDNAGTPIPGVPIAVADPSDGFPFSITRATSGADGSWRVIGLAPGTYYVCTTRFATLPTSPDPDGYLGGCVRDASGQSAFTVGSRSTTDVPALVLTGLGRVVGRVVDAVTGLGVAGVDVAVGSGQDPPHVTTGPDGSFTVGGLIPGGNAICAFAQDVLNQPPLGYADSCPLQYAEFLTEAPVIDVRERGDTVPAPIRLRQNGTVAGQVTDGHGTALRNVDVEITNDTTHESEAVGTDPSGNFVSSPMGPGTVTVCFHGGNGVRATDGGHPAGGYADECWNNQNDPTPFQLQPGQRRTGIDAVLAPRSS